ncbi:MAG: hypothetical protein JW776_16625 [Candidatus Lokiarchaeota archaeon]|nr:hypothetical protein [Candidatus Lokiarchaeota archaeon]
MVNLQEIRTMIEKQKLQSPNYYVWNCEDRNNKPNILKIGKRIWDGVLLEENVGMELGSRERPIIKTFLSLEDPSGIHNLRITVIGQDISDIPLRRCDFGFLMLMGGNTISNSDIQKIQRISVLSHSVEGFFEKRIGRLSWYQISSDLVESGLSLFHIGSTLIHLVKMEFQSRITAIEILMAVDVDILLAYFKKLHDISRVESIKQFQQKIKEIQKLRPDCDLEAECNICDNRAICDQIRDMIAKRNKIRRADE